MDIVTQDGQAVKLTAAGMPPENAWCWNPLKPEFGKPGPWDALPVTEGTGEVLEDTNPDTGKKIDWSGKKEMQVKFTDVVKRARELDETIITEKGLERMQDCGSWLLLAREAARDGKARQKLYKANFCKHKLCPMCSWRRSRRLFQEVAQCVDAMTAEHKGLRFLFITLTVKNCDATAAALKETIDALNDGFKRLVDKRKKYKAAAKFQQYCLGYMKCIEVTYNEKTNTFHPHIHVIFVVRGRYFTDKDAYINKHGWQELWAKLMKVDYDILVMPKVIDEKRKKGAVAEVAKYPTKPANLVKVRNKDKAARACGELMKGLYRRRLTTFGGMFKEYRERLGLEDVEGDDVDLVGAKEGSEISPIELVLFRWNAKFGVYLC